MCVPVCLLSVKRASTKETRRNVFVYMCQCVCVCVCPLNMPTSSVSKALNAATRASGTPPAAPQRSATACQPSACATGHRECVRVCAALCVCGENTHAHKPQRQPKRGAEVKCRQQQNTGCDMGGGWLGCNARVSVSLVFRFAATHHTPPALGRHGIFCTFHRTLTLHPPPPTTHPAPIHRPPSHRGTPKHTPHTTRTLSPCAAPPAAAAE